MDGPPDPEFQTKLKYLENMRLLYTAVALYFLTLLICMIFLGFPVFYPILTLAVGCCILISMHLNLRAVEDNIGVPRSNYEFFPFVFTNGGPSVRIRRDPDHQGSAPAARSHFVGNHQLSHYSARIMG